MWTAECWWQAARRLLLALAVLLGLPTAARAEAPHARVELLADVRGVLPGQPFALGVQFTLDRGWHVYWQNPGDSGLPPRIDWQLPAGFAAGAIEWPYPQQVSKPPVVTYGYEDEVLLAVPVTTPAGIAGPGPVSLRATVHYLVCKDLCLPEQAALRLDLPVVEQAAPDPAGQRAIAAARARLPRQLPAVTVGASRYGDRVYLDWPAAVVSGEVRFFPDREGQIRHAAPQLLERVGERARLTLEAVGGADAVTGVLVNDRGWDAAG